ncbi:hypothetical protein XELAEV_18043822mg [Xenopus laevis]|uniref:Uncharacterized protein n=1 Tax=Xenopus laevis TaxID=8355 RepID=A0A974H365_XENLA|nr:hypothetical protein XELAEV_18043822mg [Xenopus laevis]
MSKVPGAATTFKLMGISGFPLWTVSTGAANLLIKNCAQMSLSDGNYAIPLVNDLYAILNQQPKNQEAPLSVLNANFPVTQGTCYTKKNLLNGYNN